MSTFGPVSAAPSAAAAKAVDRATVTAGGASLPPMMLFTAWVGTTRNASAAAGPWPL